MHNKYLHAADMPVISNAAKIKQGAVVLASGAVLFWTGLTVSGHPKFYKNVIMPLGQKICDAESAHIWAIKLAKRGLMPLIKQTNWDEIKCTVFGRHFDNPIGLAAGFDKHGEAVDAMLRIGFGFVEVGSVTPLPQPGNTKPRVFRLNNDNAIINRYGFNSDGHEVVYSRLKSRTVSSSKTTGIVGVNLGKNKTSIDPVDDYRKGVQKFGTIADYLVINISSPNTPGLRSMQGRKQLQELLNAVVKERDNLNSARKLPILIKIAPDLTENDKKGIAEVVMKRNSGVDGLIISNTTVTRPLSLKSPDKNEVGGLSGEPLKSLSTQVIRDMYKLTEGKIPIIGVGGVATGADAYEKILAGASLIQLYTAFAYQGPPVAETIKKELVNLMKRDGFSDISSVVGYEHKKVSS